MQEQKEIQVVEFMIKLYCKKKHKCDNLCEQCKELLDYVKERRHKCPFGDDKTFCSNCKIHCYKPSMKEKIRQVMKYSGPRMMIYNPRLAIQHISETIKNKHQQKKEKKQNAKTQK